MFTLVPWEKRQQGAKWFIHYSGSFIPSLWPMWEKSFGVRYLSPRCLPSCEAEIAKKINKNYLLKSLSVNLEMLSGWKNHLQKIQLWFFSTVFLSSHQKSDLPLVPTAEWFSSVQNGLNEAGGDIWCPNLGKLNVGGCVFAHVLFLGRLVCKRDHTKRIPRKTRMVDESQPGTQEIILTFF